jgi:hypothetical protein
MTQPTGVKAHDDALFAAQQTYQATAVPGASAAVIRNADIALYRAIVASCKANNNGSGIQPALTALRELGVGQ